MPNCKNCQSEPCVKNGIVRGKQRYLCKTCGYNFVLGDARTSESIIAKKAMCVIFYSLGKASYNMLAKIFDTWPSLIYRWIKEAGLNTQEPHISPTIKEMEFDEMWHYINDKKTKNGSLKPLTVVQGELWHGGNGNRSIATFKRLYEKVKHLTSCIFYTDNWEAFKSV